MLNITRAAQRHLVSAHLRRELAALATCTLLGTMVLGCRIETTTQTAPPPPNAPVAPAPPAVQPAPNQPVVPAPAPSNNSGGVRMRGDLSQRVVANNGNNQPQPTAQGRLYIQVSNGVCDLLINDQPYGRTSSLDVILPVAQHRVTCTVQNGASEQQSVTVRERGRPARLLFDAAKIAASTSGTR